MNRFETVRLSDRISLSSDGFLTSGVTKEYLKNMVEIAISRRKVTQPVHVFGFYKH